MGLTRADTISSVFTDEKTIEIIIDRAVLYYELHKKTQSSSAYRDFIRALNAFLEEISPIDYIPGLASKIGEAIYMNLWDAEIDSSLLRKTLFDIYKVSRNSGDVNELRRDLYEILSAISDVHLLEDLLKANYEDKCLLCAAILTIVIGTNP